MQNHQARKYRFLKENILYIFQAKCVICRKQSLSNHVHHIDKNSKNNDPFNLTVMCKEHHKLAHSSHFIFSIFLNQKETAEISNLQTFLNSIKL